MWPAKKMSRNVHKIVIFDVTIRLGESGFSLGAVLAEQNEQYTFISTPYETGRIQIWHS